MAWGEKKPAYEPVSTSSSVDGIEDAHHPMLPASEQPIKSRTISRPLLLLTAFNALLWLGTIATYMFYQSRPEALNACLKATSAPSRILDELKVETMTKSVNGSFFLPPGDKMSLGRMEPGPETDALYDHFEIIRFVPIDKQQLLDNHVDPNTAVKLNDDYWGLGDDAYLGQVDNYHKIHCFNELRKAAFRGYYGEPVADYKKTQWVHLRHCADMILQDLQCHADTEFLTFQWVETQFSPFPNFNIDRKCRNFEAIDDWVSDNALDLKKYLSWPRPKDANVVPIEEGYWPLFMNLDGRPDDYDDTWTDEDSAQRIKENVQTYDDMMKKGDPYKKGWLPKNLDKNPMRGYETARANLTKSTHADGHDEHEQHEMEMGKEGSKAPPQANDHHNHRR